MSLLLWQALDELLNHPIELHRIVDEQRMSVPVEPLQLNLVSKFCLQEVGICCNAGSYAKSRVD